MQTVLNELTVICSPMVSCERGTVLKCAALQSSIALRSAWFGVSVLVWSRAFELGEVS